MYEWMNDERMEWTNECLTTDSTSIEIIKVRANKFK